MSMCPADVTSWNLAVMIYAADAHWLVELFYVTLTRYHRSLNVKINYSKMVEDIGLIFSVTLY